VRGKEGLSGEQRVETDRQARTRGCRCRHRRMRGARVGKTGAKVEVEVKERSPPVPKGPRELFFRYRLGVASSSAQHSLPASNLARLSVPNGPKCAVVVVPACVCSVVSVPWTVTARTWNNSNANRHRRVWSGEALPVARHSTQGPRSELSGLRSAERGRQRTERRRGRAVERQSRRRTAYLPLTTDH
jgi:hypothetical protein